MLPFTKRPVRSDEPSELIKTNELQVVSKGESSRRPSPVPAAPAEPPRAFAPSSADDEMTMLMPRKGMTFSARPPAPVVPVPMPKLTSSRSPRPQLEEPPTRQFVKPSAPDATPATARPQTPGQLPRTAMKPQGSVIESMPAAVADSRGSDPRLDPPATVITARTRIIAARPTVSWAAALVAMGVFVGLVTAVVARGDADTLIDAAASFVDPSGAHAAAAPAEATSTVRTKASEVHSKLLASNDTLLPEPDPAILAPLPEQAAPAPARAVAAAPVRRFFARPAPRPAAPVVHEDRVAKAAPAPKAAAPAPAKKASDDDVESATAADALAKAQLEQSLR